MASAHLLFSGLSLLAAARRKRPARVRAAGATLSPSSAPVPASGAARAKPAAATRARGLYSHLWLIQVEYVSSKR